MSKSFSHREVIAAGCVVLSFAYDDSPNTVLHELEIAGMDIPLEGGEDDQFNPATQKIVLRWPNGGCCTLGRLWPATAETVLAFNGEPSSGSIKEIE